MFRKKSVQLIICVMSSIFIVALVRPISNRSTYLRDSFWAKKIIDQPNVDIVFVGDSRVNRGIAPSSFKPYGLNAFNFGFTGSSIDWNNTNYSLKKLNPDGARIVVLGISPLSFTELTSQTFFLEKLNQSRATLFLTSTIYPLLLPFDRINVSDLTSFVTKKYSGVVERYSDSGWLASYQSPVKNADGIILFEKKLQEKKILKERISLLLDITKELKCNGYTVYGVRIPTSEHMESLEASLLKINFDSIVNLFNQNGGYFINYDYSLSLNTYDASHLDSISALTYSNYLAKQISSLQ